MAHAAWIVAIVELHPERPAMVLGDATMATRVGVGCMGCDARACCSISNETLIAFRRDAPAERLLKFEDAPLARRGETLLCFKLQTSKGETTA